MSLCAPKFEKQYEPVIDGLRAVAVLSVILFHAHVYAFPGGFIGVDIFFVISGYLITRNILHLREQGSFSFKDFYVRRARRIFPAMFFTMAATLAAGVFILSPVHLQKLAESTMYASAGIVNFHFWMEAGYWDITSNFKPLLHFWSLAVEEQFYFLWPAFLIGFLSLVKNRSMALLGLALLGLSLISLCFSQIWLGSESYTSFYMMPLRIFEFGIGAGILWLRQCPDHARFLLSILSVTGLYAIFYAATTYTESTLFPGVYALVPCMGAALVIYSRNSPLIKILLGNKAMVGMGLISYSLYLVHWPLFVFYRYFPDNPDSRYVKLALILSSIALAYLMFRYIEQPFRRPHNKNAGKIGKTHVFTAVAGLSIILALTSAVISWQGASWRVADQEISITAHDMKKMGEDINRLQKDRDESHFFDNHPAKFVIIGDSYANDIMNGLEHNGVKHPIKRFFIQAGCLPLVGTTPIGIHPRVRNAQEQKQCVDNFAAVLDSREVKSAEIIMLAAHWYDYGLGRFADTIKEIRNRTSAPVIVFGQRMIHRGSVAEAVTRYGYKNGLDEHINNKMLKEESVSLTAAIEEELEGTGALYVNIVPILCPDLQCPILLEDGSISMIDDGHWTLGGAKIFGRLFRNSNSAAARLLFWNLD